MSADPVTVESVEMRHGDLLVQRDLSFRVRRGEVFAVVGRSGSGKSTLLRHLIGLQAPARGRVLHRGVDLYAVGDAEMQALRRRFGVMFQAGALWSSMTVGENLLLPMQLFTDWPADDQRRKARFKLALVGLDGSFDRMPAELSGGMRKRAAIARALALDPELLFLDEPGSGLDPVNAARLDELVLNLRHHLGTTVVMVTHEIASVMAVADRVLYLDEEEQTMTALDAPIALRDHGPPKVREFFSRGHTAIVPAVSAEPTGLGSAP
jgi:phospholipid/cholesterol/gamma-HCH transport system ATP-binding protein